MTQTTILQVPPGIGGGREEAADSDIAAINLNRLLARLKLNILSPSADLTLLRRSQYHRVRVGANLEYARSLLSQIERSVSKSKATVPPERRHDWHTNLTQKRQTLNLLNDRLDAIAAEAEAAAPAEEEDEDNDDEEEEDGEKEAFFPQSDEEAEEEEDDDDDEHGDILATPTSSHENGYEDGRMRRQSKSEEEGGDDQKKDDLGVATTTAITMTTLRHRHHSSHPPKSSSALSSSISSTTAALPRPQSTKTPAATATSTSTSTSALFPSQSTSTTAAATASATTDSTLSAHRIEQESLTDSLLTLATKLKLSSHTFQSSLEAERAVLGRAVEGLDKNTTGMDVAGKRMGMLRRMTEGKGWWGRLLMYIWIFALWLVALGIVYLGPKLRF
ncbi:hypothetical protein V8E54_004591 [Elaphomyces granulatus]|jgi:hypothetical protein